MSAPTFRVQIAEARDILAADSNGFSDPYVTMTLLDSRGATLAAGGSFKTKTQKKTLSPKWYEEFVIGDKLDLRVATTLRLLVYDSDGFMSDDVLGVVDIPVALFLDISAPVRVSNRVLCDLCLSLTVLLLGVDDALARQLVQADEAREDEERLARRAAPRD